MKFWTRILITGTVVLAIIFLSVYFFLVFQGQAFITKQLEGLTHKKVTMGYFGLTPPLNIEIKNLAIEDMAKVDSIFLSSSIPSLLMGKIAFNAVKINKPEFTYERGTPKISELSTEVTPGAATAFTDTSGPATASADTSGSGTTVISSSPAAAATSVSVAPPAAPSPTPTSRPAKKRKLRLIFKRLNIKDGKIDFIDHTAGQSGIKITLKDINFNLTDLYLLPRSAITNFELKARIPWHKDSEEGSIEAEGWLNFHKKDIQATLKIKDIDGIYLYPYYSMWVDLEKARIEKAKLNFSSDIQGLNNNVTAQCHLELTDIVFKPRPPEESEEKAEKIASAVLDMFKALNQGKIVLDFTIRTKMDRPEFGFHHIKMAVEDKLAQARKPGGFTIENILALPTNLLQGAVKGATDLSKAVIDGTFSVGKELKKAVEDTFKKEKKE